MNEKKLLKVEKKYIFLPPLSATMCRINGFCAAHHENAV
jgi:hypothetical protein